MNNSGNRAVIFLLTAIIAAVLSLSACGNDEAATDVTADVLCLAALGGASCPETAKTDNETLLSDIIGDCSEYEDYAVYRQLMSVDLAEVIVIKGGDNADDVLEKRLEKLKTEFSYYPAQKQATDEAITGAVGDFHYLICCENSDDMEEALIKRLDG